MAMREIDTIIIRSIECIKNSDLENDIKRHLIWSLENLPETYNFDAGGFDKSELDDTFQYREIDPFELGLFVTDEVKETDEIGLIYDWSAFLLNYNGEYFSQIDNEQKLEALSAIKKAFLKLDFSRHIPLHPSLAIYPNGHKSFSEIQNNLIRWFLTYE